MNWRHVVEHFPNIFCLSLPRSSPSLIFPAGLLHPLTKKKLSFFLPALFYFFAAVIFLGLLNYVSMGRKSHLLLLEYRE